MGIIKMSHHLFKLLLLPLQRSTDECSLTTPRIILARPWAGTITLGTALAWLQPPTLLPVLVAGEGDATHSATGQVVIPCQESPVSTMAVRTSLCLTPSLPSESLPLLLHSAWPVQCSLHSDGSSALFWWVASPVYLTPPLLWCQYV